MILLVVLWFVFGTLSLGAIVFNFVSMKRLAQRPWRIRIEEGFRPEVSIIVPTYNESSTIGLKLENLAKLRYPRNLTKIIVVDSNSTDQTLKIVNDFVKHHNEINIQVLTENERSGKSAALNYALKNCDGEVVLVSDADCFWPPDILDKALPYLADSNVAAVSGPKVLLNPTQSWVAKTEEAYLKSANMLKLGESKVGSTLLFEGGFSAYKRRMIQAFDPYNTGSDDCGTIIKIVESDYRAIFVTEAAFFTAFPVSLRGKMSIKMRRANQLVRVFSRYAGLLITNRLKNSKRTVFRNVFLYLVSPFMFVLFLLATILVVVNFPYFALIFLIFFVPKVRFYFFEAAQGFCALFVSFFSVALGRKMVVWDTPEDRSLVSENLLRQKMLL